MRDRAIRGGRPRIGTAGRDVYDGFDNDEAGYAFEGARRRQALL